MTVQKLFIKNKYTGDGVNKTFPITFEWHKDHTEHIHVYVRNSAGTLEKTNNYELAYNSDSDSYYVSYPFSGEPLAPGECIVIARLLPLQQVLNLVNQGPYFAEDVELTFDEVVMMIQQISENVGRALKVGVDIDVDKDIDVNIPVPIDGVAHGIRITDKGFELTADPGIVYEKTIGLNEDIQDAAERAEGAADNANRSAEAAADSAEVATNAASNAADEAREAASQRVADVLEQAKSAAERAESAAQTAADDTIEAARVDIDRAINDTVNTSIQRVEEKIGKIIEVGEDGLWQYDGNVDLMPGDGAGRSKFWELMDDGQTLVPLDVSTLVGRLNEKIEQLDVDNIYTKTQMDSLLSNKANANDVYGKTSVYTKTEADNLLNNKAAKATTLAGYGITDAKINNGVITLGGNTITPLTSHQSLSGYVPTTRTINSKELSSNISLTASDVGASASNHNHDSTYLKITGGTATGFIAINNSNPYYQAKHNSAVRGTAIASNTTIGGYWGVDKNGNNCGAFRVRVDTSGKPYSQLVAIGTDAIEYIVEVASGSKWLAPNTNKQLSLGGSGRLWTTVYANTTTISTSDERLKDNIQDFPDEVLDAWGEVNFKQYQMKDSVAEKGNNARLHTGCIAQQIKAAFENHNLDASRYGLFCFDKWDANEEHEAGEQYSLRYEELLCLEAAYQRRRADRLEMRLSAIEAKLGGI